jgi:hypothetical protein
MILSQVDRAVRLGKSSKDLVLWKMDLKGAFTLLFLHPEHCGYLTLQLTGKLSYIPISGNFGMTQFPFVFDVFSRSLDRQINLVISGASQDYTDDIQGCCLQVEVEEDITKATGKIIDLFGDDAVADEKTEHGREIEWIGWKFNLDTMTVSIADHNYYKTLYSYMIVVRGAKVTIRQLHTLASWASRYTLVCPFMAPFSGYLFSAFSGYNNLEVQIPLPDTAYLVITLWRVFFFMMKLKPEYFTRPIESFRPYPPAQFRLEVDGCPQGIGVIIHERMGGRWSRIFAFSWCQE